MLSTEGNVTTPLSCYKKPDFHSYNCSSILGELDYCSLAKCHLQTFSLSPHQPKQILTNFKKKYLFAKYQIFYTEKTAFTPN